MTVPETIYPVGIQNFTKIREEGFLYVDKTAYVYQLIAAKGYYFLSRPRRFGKSLLLSTIEAYYNGRRDLFKGLALDRLTDDWDPHPVLHLDLNNKEYVNRQSLEEHLSAYLTIWENKYATPNPDRSPEENSPDIYNPFSLVNVFAKMKMASYWIDSGTPTFLVKLMEREEWLLRDLAPVEISQNELETAGILSGDLISALYQTGYLSIKEYDSVFSTYTLDYPNEEVREGFISFLVPYYIKTTSSRGKFNIKKFVSAVTEGDIDGFRHPDTQAVRLPD